MCTHHSKQEESTNPEVDKALYILQHTQNGNDLAPEDLKLVELYMNRRLNEQGMKTLEELYQSVVRGY